MHAERIVGLLARWLPPDLQCRLCRATPICSCPESVMQATVLLHGAALNQDGRSSSLTAPSGPAQQSLIRSALQSAHMLPSRVRALISVHACVCSRQVACTVLSSFSWVRQLLGRLRSCKPDDGARLMPDLCPCRCTACTCMGRERRWATQSRWAQWQQSCCPKTAPAMRPCSWLPTRPLLGTLRLLQAWSGWHAPRWRSRMPALPPSSTSGLPSCLRT